MSRLGKKIPIRACAFTFSLKLEKWSFHVADLSRTGKKCTEIIKSREGRAKVMFLLIKYAKFVALLLPPRRRCYTRYCKIQTRRNNRKIVTVAQVFIFK